MRFCKLIPLAILLIASVSQVSGTRCTNKVVKFQTFDPYFGVETDLVRVPSGPAVIDFDKYPDCELAITAVTESFPSGCDEGKIKCVELSLGSYRRKEKLAPYTLYGDVNYNLRYGRPRRGVQNLKACPYTDSACTQGKGMCLDLQVDVQDYYLPNFVLYDAKLGYNGRIDYIYEGQPICMPKSGQVNMIALFGCYVNKVYFSLTGGDKMDERNEYDYPFFLYGISGDLYDGTIFGKGGFKVGTEYTVSATPDNDVSRKIERHFSFKKC